MDIFWSVITVIVTVIYGYLWLSVFYMFFYSFMGLFPPRKRLWKKVKIRKRKFAVYIPGYKEDAVIVEVAKEALKQNYPKELFDVIVIADSFQDDTMRELEKLDIKVIEVSFEKSTKAKALNKAMKLVEPLEYDVALILDADNIMELDFITKINSAFNRGYQIVQGHRVAKNLDSTYALLDAISEELNNTIYNKGQRVVGMSTRLVGSGMAFNFELFRKTMSEIKAIGGFDKELELRLLRQGYEFEYVGDAYVYDEKVQNSEVMVNQRSRWISAQFYYLKTFFLSSLYHVFTDFNLDFFNKVFQMALPPRLLLPGVLAIISLITFFIGQPQWIWAWNSLLLLNVVAYFMAIPFKYYNGDMVRAIFSLPIAFAKVFMSMLKIGGANKTFIHTPHSSGKVDNKIINKEKDVEN